MNSPQAGIRARMRASSSPVFLIGLHMHRRGYDIEIPAMTYASDVSEIESHVDRGDLFVHIGGERRRFECRHWERTSFTCRGDFPHPHFFVGNIEPLNRATDLYAAVQLCKETTHMGIVMADTRPSWYETRFFNPLTKREEQVYAVPIDLVAFKPLVID